MRLLSPIIWALLLPLAACGQVTSMSAYDPSKAPLLSEEKRREYDILLANELATWNTNTTRCNLGADFDPDCREKFFRQLATEGYEVADIVSQIYFPRIGVMRPNRAAYERLRKLADAGDKSALCFAPYVFGRMEQQKDWPYTGETEANYTKRGAALKLPLCAINEFYSYWSGANGYPEDHRLAHQRLLEAAKAGLFFGQRHLMTDYEQQGYEDLHVIRKALCWGRLADRHSPSSGRWSYASNVKMAAFDPTDGTKLIRPELLQLGKEWYPSNKPQDGKQVTINDCVKIEEEK